MAATSQRVQTQGTLNRYTSPKLTKRTRHQSRQRDTTFKVPGYSSPNAFSKREPLRYRVAGDDITVNPQHIRTLD